MLRAAVVTRKYNMVDVYFSGISAQEAMSDACNAKALLWDLMPMGMVGIDGDEHIDAAMRVAASDGDRCAL